MPASVFGPDSKKGWIEAHRDGPAWVLSAGGQWTIDCAGDLDLRLRQYDPGDARETLLNLGGLHAFDVSGAWLLHRLIKDLHIRGHAVTIGDIDGGLARLLETIGRYDVAAPPPAPQPHLLIATVAHVGRASIQAAAASAELLSFLGQTVIALGRSLRRPSRIRVRAVVALIEKTGLDAMPIVGLISFLIGVVLAYQGADQLARFGAEIFTVNLVGIGVLREMGVLLTAIMLAGRSGSAFTAQIGTMKVNEEVDAMRTIGMDPMEVLVLPRVLALMVSLPLLTFFADIMGLLGGAVMATTALDISFFQFARQLNAAVPISALLIGLMKAPVFAFIIALVGCFEGLKVSGSAESVGQHTTRAVVESVFLVMVLDAVFSILFSVLGI